MTGRPRDSLSAFQPVTKTPSDLFLWVRRRSDLWDEDADASSRAADPAPLIGAGHADGR